MNNETIKARLASMFSGWDLVQVDHADNVDAWQVRLLMTTKRFQADHDRYHGRHLSSKAAQDHLHKSRPSDMRFYGRRRK